MNRSASPKLLHLPLCCIALAACVVPDETTSDGMDTTGPGTSTGGESDDGPMSPPSDPDTSGSGSEAGADSSTGDSDPFPPLDSSGGDDPAGTTGEPGCPGTMACIPLAPIDWEGPFELNDGATGCSGLYEVVAYAGGNAPAADDASCECGCDVTSASCNPDGRLQYWFGGECSITPDEWYTLDPSASIGEPSPGSVRVSAYTGDGGHDQAACQTEVLSASFPAASFQTPAVACEWSGTQIDCDAGRCLPPVDGGEMCIAREGEHECPADGPFQSRRVYYGGIDDDRACACDCDTTIACEHDLAVLTVLTSQGAQIGTPVAESTGCTTVPYIGTILAASFVPSAPEATCDADSTITGDVTPVQPWTACCM